MDTLSIKQWAVNDRPREKLNSKGVKSLSDAELIAILLGSGTRDISAVELARQILSSADNNLTLLGRKAVSELKIIKGIGEAKAVCIVAAMELGRRLRNSGTPDKIQVTSSRDACDYFHPLLAGLSHEEFWVIYLNRSNRIIGDYKLSQGGIVGTVIDLKLILKRALEFLASSLIICHNHPSGNLQPSENDRKITEKLKIAAGQMDIKLLDHLIVADNSYFSFADEGLL